ncbi:uncharacterized GPI-anchored protein At1g61900-like [Alnus glutinosa]|uniref:uncharacterized GPI-anchored protein At1g61900-like n=1 Tax=Alnus glutinosa TaxID=3517 RepID=UPI002D76F800|nr:uncharacterized GPI-anchored protein At1g61900-like [Alnus glutinosa]XP_062152255.1 uncharacterized GPI-anchored protein At1g61900-like [Alnus glutinosa]
MEQRVSCSLTLQLALFLLLCLCETHSAPFIDIKESLLMETKVNALAPDISPSADSQPFLPLLSPSPLIPFTNSSVPKLSGLCALNFSASESVMSITATDCWASFAPYLANVVCCPQFDATVVIIIGQSSEYSRSLALNKTHAKHCLSDVEKILESQGANDNLQKICSFHPENLTEFSCPVTDVDEFERTVDSSRLMVACGRIDPVNECCDQVCQNAILDAARKIALNGMSNTDGFPVSLEHSTRIDDCKNIVLRWLASKLDPSSANSVLRRLSNCNVNKVCPLVFPNMTNILKECGNVINNQTACCKAMESYVSQLQQQSFLTNLQALNCAASLGMRLQEANVSYNVYNLCHINLKDFSLQVGSQESGCLLPSLPSDATYDKTSGVSFVCDLNDNIAAPWPSKSYAPASTCNKTAKLPQLPTATSAQSGRCTDNLMLMTSLLLLNMLL